MVMRWPGVYMVLVDDGGWLIVAGSQLVGLIASVLTYTAGDADTGPSYPSDTYASECDDVYASDEM